MLFETKVLDGFGNLKRVISGEELKRRHWKNFRISEENGSFFSKKLRKGKLRTDSKNISDLAGLGDETY